MATICIFGDSITWGAVDPEQGGWANRLRNYFEAQGLPVDQDVDVYNLGISGDNTDDLLLRFDVESRARQPDMVIFAIGINDSQFVISKQENRVPVTKFSQNIISLIDRAKRLAGRVMVIGLTRVDESKTNPIPWNTDKRYLNEDIRIYDSALRDIAGAQEVDYLDVSQLLSPEDLIDGLHPNSAGHQKFFELVKSCLESRFQHRPRLPVGTN